MAAAAGIGLPDEHIPAAIAAATALAVAAATAVTTDQRLDKQLRHDRQAAERESLRAVLDEATDSLSRAKRAYETIFTLHENACPRETKQARAAFDDRRATMERVFATRDRLLIRLGEEHRVFKAYRDSVKALTGQRPFAVAYETGESTDEPKKAARAAHKAFRTHRTTYARNAQDLVGTRLY